MGTKKNAFRKLALAVAVPGVAFGTLAGVAAPAMGGTAQTVASSYERISGFSNGSGTSVGVQVTGAFNDNGSLDLSSGTFTILNLSRGTQYVYEYGGSTTTTTHASTCSETLRTTIDLYFYGGTGAYSGLYGTGTATVTQTGSVPRVGGVCQTASGLIANTIHTTLVATGQVSNDV